MTRAAFVIPGDISLPTGGYGYDRRVLARFAAHGVECMHIALPGSYPSPTTGDLVATEAALAALPADTVLLIDGLAFGAMPGDLVARIKQKIVALVHHPLCLEAGLTPMRQRLLKQTETMAVAFAEHVVVTSPMTRRIVAADFGVAAVKLTVAEPGTDRAERAMGAGGQNNKRLLAVGSVVPRKAYDVLIEALSGLTYIPRWNLTIAGAERDEALAQHLRAMIRDLKLVDRINFAGAVSDAALAILYRDSDLFVMSSLFEGYGMVLGEAMSYGLPIVCTTGGAATDTVPDAAGLKVPPGNMLALRTALGKALTDENFRRRMAEASWAAGQKLPTWDDTARIIAAVLKKVSS